MSDSDLASNPELELQLQVEQILEYWKSRGQIIVYRELESGEMETGRLAKFDKSISDSSLRADITAHLKEGWKYKMG